MKKIILLMLATTFVFTEAINVTVGDCTDNGDGTVTFALDLQSDADLYGFQFTIDPGSALVSGAGASGGLAADAAWLVQIGGNGTVLGFSMQSNAVLAQPSSANLTNLSFNASDGACEAGLALVDAQPNEEITVWGLTYSFSGHTFTSFECSDPMYTNSEDCLSALEDWAIVVLDHSWTNGVESIEDNMYSIRDFRLGENFPNPFNPSTVISYDVAISGDVSLKIFNMRGQEVNTLASGFHSTNSYTVTWNGTDRNGVEMPAGMYIYKLIADGFVQSNKMLFVK